MVGSKVQRDSKMKNGGAEDESPDTKSVKGTENDKVHPLIMADTKHGIKRD